MIIQGLWFCCMSTALEIRLSGFSQDVIMVVFLDVRVICNNFREYHVISKSQCFCCMLTFFWHPELVQDSVEDIMSQFVWI